jgi:hypothetical protein
MIQIRCTTAADADRLWRMLATVADEHFCTADVYVAGEFAYKIVRTADGGQTTTPLAGHPVSTP